MKTPPWMILLLTWSVRFCEEKRENKKTCIETSILYFRYTTPTERLHDWRIWQNLCCRQLTFAFAASSDCPTVSVFFGSSPFRDIVSFLAAAFAKLKEGRTVGTKEGPEALAGDCFDWGWRAEETGGVWGRVNKPLSTPVRELVRDMVNFSCCMSRSRSRRSDTSLSRALTSTGLMEH